MARISSFMALATILSFMGVLSPGATAVTPPTAELAQRSVIEESSSNVLEAKQRQCRPWQPFTRCPCNYSRQGNECRPTQPPFCGPGYVWDYDQGRCERSGRTRRVHVSREAHLYNHYRDKYQKRT